MNSSTLPSTTTLGGGGWSAPRPGCFTPGKDPVPIVQKAGWTLFYLRYLWCQNCSVSSVSGTCGAKTALSLLSEVLVVPKLLCLFCVRYLWCHTCSLLSQVPVSAIRDTSTFHIALPVNFLYQHLHHKLPAVFLRSLFHVRCSLLLAFSSAPAPRGHLW